MTLMACGDQRWWDFPPNKNIFIAVNRALILIFSPVCIITQLVYMYINYHMLTFSTLGIIFCILPVTFIVNVSTVSIQKVI